MCGIFGYAGKDPKKFNKDKFDKLGFYNISRGRDSCGVSFDGDIIAGASHNDKLYSDFIIKNNDIKVTKYPIVIGHTRSASIGNLVNIDNAHPFGFGTNKKDDGYEFIGCHNGTLYNSKELADEYEIEKTERRTEINNFGTKTVSTRTKIDSEILLEIIYTQKNFKVLSKYVGAAAIVFTNTNEPNKLYVFKGASKNWGYSTCKIEEERPLFYYTETKNSMYFSSIKDSLIAIGGNEDKNIHSFEDNLLYIITDGDVKNAETLVISRENATQKERATTTYSNHNAGFTKKNQAYFEMMNDEYNSSAIALETANFINKQNCKVGSVLNNKITANIYNEGLLLEQNDYGKRVYFNKLRYWQKGHLINGIYTFIEGYGFYKLVEEGTKINAVEKLKELLNVPFIDGDFDKSLKGAVEQNGMTLFIPIKKSSVDHLYYFVEGCKIKTSLDYSFLLNEKTQLHKSVYLNVDKLSHVTTHPIMDLKRVLADNNQQNIIKEAKAFSGVICPLGSERTYTIVKGNLISSSVSNYAKSTIWGDKPVSYKASKLILLNKENATDSKSILIPQFLSKDIEESKDNRHYASANLKEFVDDKNVEVIEDSATGELLLELINEDLNEFKTMIEKNLNMLNNRVNKSVKEIQIHQELKNIKDQLTIIVENEEN
jgi:hypothetical protein